MMPQNIFTTYIRDRNRQRNLVTHAQTDTKKIYKKYRNSHIETHTAINTQKQTNKHKETHTK